MIGNVEDPRKVFGKAVTDTARDNKDVVVISTDSGGSSGFGDFMKDMPERYLEIGIMEQAAVGIAAGLATTNKIPVYCAIAPFVTARVYEMFRNDVGYMRQNVKIVGRNSGITYSELGATHHSLDDFAIIGMIPGVVILAPQDPNEIRAAVKTMLSHIGPVYMRIGNGVEENFLPEQAFEIGKGRKISDGSDVTIISTGSITSAVVKAAALLEAKGLRADVLGLPTVSPLDKSIIVASVAKTKNVVVVEEHYTCGGLGTAVSDLICEEDLKASVLKIGVPHCYATSGPYKEILASYGMDKDSIAKRVEDFIQP